MKIKSTNPRKNSGSDRTYPVAGTPGECLKYLLGNPHLRYQARTELVKIVDRFLVDYVDTGRFLEERPGHKSTSQEARLFSSSVPLLTYH